MNRISCDMRLKFMPATDTKPQRALLQQYEGGKWRTVSHYDAEIGASELARTLGCVIIDVQSPDFLYLASKD